MTNPVCWKCGNSISSELVNGKVPLRAACSRCLSALHSCLACIHYKRGLSNDCVIQDIEHVKDKDVTNFCEEFTPAFAQGKKMPSSKDIESKLFGDNTKDLFF